MATKITDLVPLGTAPTNTDVLHIIDVSDTSGTASGTSKKITVSNLLASAGAVDSVNGQTGVVVLDTDDIGEGTTNLYFTDARVAANSAVTANTSKVGITPTQASNITANNAKIATVVDDTSPQLGGNLDVQAFEIDTSVANGSIVIAPKGTGVLEVKGATNSAAIQLNCEINTHGVKIQAPPHSATANYTLVLPNNTGTNGQVLTTNGSGTLSFTTVSGGGGVTVNTQAVNRLVACSSTTDTLDGEANLTFNGSELSVTGDVTTTGKISGNGSSLAVGKLETAIATAGSAGEVGLNAEVVTIVTTTGLNAGYVYYLGSSAWTSSDADALASSVGFMAVATSASSATGMVIRGIVYLATDTGGSVGDVVYLSTATGRLSTTPVSATGDISRVMGYKIGTNLVFFNPSQDWIEIS